jgi:hypothetical protein
MDGRYGATARSGPRAALLIAAPLLAVALLTGCGSDKKDPGIATAGGGKPQPAASAQASASADRDEALRQFAQCMRDNGVQMNDPDPNGGGFGFGGGGTGGPRGGGGFRADFNNPNFQKAIEACRTKLPNGGAPPTLSPEQLDALRAFTQCMRDHGVDVPDPDPNSPAFGFLRGGRIDPNNPNFRSAMDACRDKLPFGRGGPGGPGGAGASPSPTAGA